MFGVCAGVLCGYSMKECGRIVAVEVEVCGWFAVCGLRLRCDIIVVRGGVFLVAGMLVIISCSEDFGEVAGSRRTVGGDVMNIAGAEFQDKVRFDGPKLAKAGVKVG